MPTYEVDVSGVTYEVDAPDEKTAWKWANATHQKSAKPDRSMGDELSRQVGLTARAGAEGLAGLAGVFSDPIAVALNAALPEDQKIGFLRETVSNILTRAGVPVPETPIERIAQAGAQAMAGAGGSAAAAQKVGTALANPVARVVAQQLGTQPTQQIVSAGASGVSGQTASEAGAGPVAQTAASLAGGVAGARLAAPTAAAPVRRPAIIDEAERAGVPVLTSDIRQPKTFAGRWAQSAGERVPVAGTGPVRAAQQEQRIDAVRNLLRDFGADDAAQAPDNVMADLLKKRSADITKYTKMKGDVIDSLDGVAVPVANASKAIDDEIARLSGLKTAEVQPIIARLDDFKQSIQGQGLRNIEELRKQLGESFKAPELASVRSIGEKSLSGIYGPLKQDMREFITANGQRRDVTKWAVADRQLSAMMSDLKSTAVKSTLKRGDTNPEVIKGILFGKKESDLRTLYKNLTPEGRANARAAILAEAYRDTNGSPERFVNSLGKLGAPVGVFFQADDLARVEGLQRVLQVTRRAGEAAANPPTGQQLALPVGAAVLTDLLGGAGAAITTGVGVGGLARVYESKPVRDLLLRIAQTKRGTPEEAALVKRVLTIIQQQTENKD